MDKQIVAYLYNGTIKRYTEQHINLKNTDTKNAH